MPLGQKFSLCTDSSLFLAAEVTNGDQQMGRWSTRLATSLGIASEATEIISSEMSFSLSPPPSTSTLSQNLRFPLTLPFSLPISFLLGERIYVLLLYARYCRRYSHQ